MELKPCPFCGGPASLGCDSGNEVYPQSWNPGCEKCGIRFKAYGSSSWATNKKADEAAKSLAVGVWNKRVPAEAAEQRVREQTVRAEWMRSVLIGIERIGIDSRGERRYSGDNFATAIEKVKLTLDIDTERMANNGYAALTGSGSADNG